jgi:glucose-6-phosphate 1-dehydrogenase
VVTLTSLASFVMSCRTVCLFDSVFGVTLTVGDLDLLQVLTLLTMERPISFSAEDIRDEKVRVLRAMPAIEPKNVIIGQYGKSLDGAKPGYKDDDTVPKESRCPTFASMVAYIKNERWDGVPFILKAGKGMFFCFVIMFPFTNYLLALNEQKTEVRIQFRDVTSGIFKDIPRNELVIRVQPNESVYIKMNSKLPGLSMQTVGDSRTSRSPRLTNHSSLIPSRATTPTLCVTTS